MQPRAAARERAPQQARQPQLQPHLSQGSVPLHWLWLWPWRPWRVLLMLGALVAMPMFVVLTLLSLLFVLLMLLLLRPLAQAPQLLPQALLRLLQLHQQFVVDLYPQHATCQTFRRGLVSVHWQQSLQRDDEHCGQAVVLCNGHPNAGAGLLAAAAADAAVVLLASIRCLQKAPSP